MKKQDKKPFGLKRDLKLLSKTELDKVEGGCNVPPKIGSGDEG